MIDHTADRVYRHFITRL